MNGWRDYLTKALERRGFEVRNPMKRIGLLPQEIVEGDLEDIRHCSGVIAFVPDEEACRGTSCEIMYAKLVCQMGVALFGYGKRWSPWNQYFADVLVEADAAGPGYWELDQLLGVLFSSSVCQKFEFKTHVRP